MVELRDQCLNAAEQLGFAVPCPARVPLVRGRPVRCTGGCVAPEGSPPMPIFFFEVQGFDVPRKYRGVDGRPVGHLIIEARRPEDAGPLPCAAATDAGMLTIQRRSISVFECPSASNAIEQGVIQHGEGAHSNHVLLAWDEGGIKYAASAHGHTTVNLRLLRRIVESIELVGPPSSRGSAAGPRDDKDYGATTPG
jgi:hypothetical protein